MPLGSARSDTLFQQFQLGRQISIVSVSLGVRGHEFECSIRLVMEGHTVAAMPEEQLKICRTGCWRTCEELLLVSAVKRHGGRNWNLISEELKARSVSLNVSPRYFSEAACKEKYDILRERYANSSSSSRSRSEDLGNDTDWYEELRRLRVAHLKRELKHYDGSIGTLQIKIKRLKAENSEDALLSRQLRKTIKNFQSTEEVRGDFSCEISVHRSAGKCLDLHATPVVLVSKMDSEEDLWCQEPSNVRNQALPEGEQWLDASEDLLVASRAFSEKTRVIVVKSSPPSSVIGSNDAEQGDGKKMAVLSKFETSRYETPAVPESLADDLRDVDADKVGASRMHEHPMLGITRIGYQLAGSMVSHEAGDILSDALDNDKGNAVIMDGQQLPVKKNVLNDEMGSGHTDYGQEGMDRTIEISAGSIVSTEVSKNGGSCHAATDTHSIDVFFPIRPSSQLLLNSGIVGSADDWNADLTTVTVGRINVSKNEEDMRELEKKLTVAIEDTYRSILEVGPNNVHAALPLDLTKVESGVQLGRNLLECYADIARITPAFDSILKSTRKALNVSEGCHISHKGLPSAILDEVASCDQKQLLWEEDSVKEVDTALRVVKKLAAFGVESEELDRCSDDVAGESVSISKESEKLPVSAAVPSMSLINLESCVSRGGATIILEKSDLSESASRFSGLSYKSDVAEGSPSPERHIVIARDGPGVSAPNSEIVSISLASGEDNNAYHIETPTRSDVVCNTQARGTVQELHISAVSSRIADSCEEMDWETPHETPATVTDLLEQVHMTGQANPLQSVSLVVHPVPCSDVASFTIVSPAIVSTFEPGQRSSIVALRAGHDVEMALETVIHCDRQPCTLESPMGDFDPQDSSAIHGVELVEINGLVANQDAFLIDIAKIRVEPRESRGACDEQHLQFHVGQSSELAIPASLEVEGRQLSYNCIKKSPLLTTDPHSRVIVETVQEVIVDIRQVGTDLTDGSHGAESKLPEIVLNMNLEYSREGLYGVESDADPSSPLEFLTGDLYSMMPSGHEGSDSVQGQDQNEPNEPGGMQQIGDNAESDVDKSEAGSPLVGPNEMSPSSARYRKETRVSRKLFPLLEVFRNLSNHKSAIFFKGRQEDPRYSSLIRRHLDLNSVRSRLDEGSYSSSSEFFRDLLLIFNNAMVYYTRGSVQYRGARALVAEATKEMNRVFRTEYLLKQDRPATRTREVKKATASAGDLIPRKIVAPVIGADSSGNMADMISPLTNLPASGIRKRSSSRLGFVETLINSHSEAVAARSASASFLGGPSSGGTEDAEYYYRENDQEVNGSLKERKNHRKGSGFCWGGQPRVELLEGALLKNAAIMGCKGAQMRGVKDNEASARKPALPMTGVMGKSMAELQFSKQRKAVYEKTRRIEGQGVLRNEINDDNFLRKGETFIKLRGLDVISEKEPDGKPIPKLRASAAVRVASKSHGSISRVVGRPFSGGRKPVTIAKESVRPKEPQAKKRMRK